MCQNRRKAMARWTVCVSLVLGGPGFFPGLSAEEPRRQTLTGHTDGVTAVAFSPDGQVLASGSADRAVRLWDVATGRVKASLRASSAIPLYGVSSVAFSPDGKVLASGGGGLLDKPITPGEVQLWAPSRGRALATLKGHTDGVNAVAFSVDGQVLASESADQTVKLWDVPSGQGKATLKGHTDAVTSVAFSPDGNTLASGSADRTIRLWDVSAARKVKVLGDWVQIRHDAARKGYGLALAAYRTGQGDAETVYR